MRTVLLLIGSNIFMNFAWYGHLKFRGSPLLTVILVSWLIALPEYALQVPANRLGFGQFTSAQLKILQEVISLSVFVPIAWWALAEAPKLDYLWAAICILGAVFFIFRGQGDPLPQIAENSNSTSNIASDGPSQDRQRD